jgi:hypothetical protein
MGLFSITLVLGDQLPKLPGQEVFDAPLSAPVKGADNTQLVEYYRLGNWIAPSISDQMSRDATLLTLGKGAVFLPSYTEGRLEPEVAVFNSSGNQVADGHSGARILLDSGDYRIQFGSGSAGRSIRKKVRVEEGQTTIIQPDWGGLVVETISPDGEYLESPYELISMDAWLNYGKGYGMKEERLQDVRTWILQPGMYRLSKAGESYNSLQNFITLQINPGELHSVELIFDPTTGNLIAGGIKALQTRTRGGRSWTYGVRAGGNLALIRVIDESDESRESILFATDLRLRAKFDNSRYFGLTEMFLENSFVKESDRSLSANSDQLQLRSTWVRRLNAYVGPYVRGQVTTHLFPNKPLADTVYRVNTRKDPLTPGKTLVDTLGIEMGPDFEIEPSFFPIRLAEGAGANLEILSTYPAEVTTQVGVAARQKLSRGEYLARSANTFERSSSDFEIGVEALLNARFRLGTQLTLDLRTEIFAPNADFGETRLDDLEADLRFYLSRNLEIGYLFRIRETLEAVANRYPSSHSVSMRLSFNY